MDLLLTPTLQKPEGVRAKVEAVTRYYDPFATWNLASLMTTGLTIGQLGVPEEKS